MPEILVRGLAARIRTTENPGPRNLGTSLCPAETRGFTKSKVIMLRFCLQAQIRSRISGAIFQPLAGSQATRGRVGTKSRHRVFLNPPRRAPFPEGSEKGAWPLLGAPLPVAGGRIGEYDVLGSKHAGKGIWDVFWGCCGQVSLSSFFLRARTWHVLSVRSHLGRSCRALVAREKT